MSNRGPGLSTVRQLCERSAGRENDTYIRRHEEEQYHLFNTPHKRQKTKTSELVSSLKSDRNLFLRLHVASQFRDGNRDEFFSHENQPCSPSLSDRGKHKLGTKSDIVRFLEDAIEEQDDITPSVEVVVLDGPAIVHMLKPAAASTFREYAQDVFLPYVEHQLDKAHRVDVVWDDYRTDSVKAQMRDMRGKGIRRRVEPNNAVPKNWAEFLRINENKTELFAFLSREIVTISTDKQVICTLDRDVICCQPMDKEGQSPCSHKEADSRMMVHVAHAANTYNNILIRTVDSDVVVLAVYAFAQLNSSLNEHWVAFGTGKHFRLLPAYKICAAIGLDKCLALHMFHAFTGCDTVSFFWKR